MKTEVSIIIAFYNNLDFLKKVLAGFKRQQFQSFELVIADDGSNETVVKDLNELIRTESISMQHIWHKDSGWRKTQILNKAVQAAKGNYLIFIDGDCIPHCGFVKEHYENRKKGTFLAGRRVHLSPRITESLTTDHIEKGYLEHPFKLLWDSVKPRPRTKNAEKSIYVRSKAIRLWINSKPKELLGCNMSMHKSDLLSLNGFDERFIDPGVGEDIDLYVRAQQAGFDVQSVKNIAIQYHMDHGRSDRSDQEHNFAILEENRSNQVTKTAFSIFST